MDKVEVPIIACNDGLPHPHRDREQTTPVKTVTSGIRRPSTPGGSWKPGIPGRKSRDAEKTGRGSRIRSASAGRDPKSELTSRYWSYLFGNLERSISEIYDSCEKQDNVLQCKEVLLILETYVRDFNKLIEWLNLKWSYEQTPPPMRPNALAWEIRKPTYTQGMLPHTRAYEKLVGIVSSDKAGKPPVHTRHSESEASSSHLAPTTSSPPSSKTAPELSNNVKASECKKLSDLATPIKPVLSETNNQQLSVTESECHLDNRVDVSLQTDFAEDPDVYYFAGGRSIACETDPCDQYSPLTLLASGTTPVIIVLEQSDSDTETSMIMDGSMNNIMNESNSNLMCDAHATKLNNSSEPPVTTEPPSPTPSAQASQTMSESCPCVLTDSNSSAITTSTTSNNSTNIDSAVNTMTVETKSSATQLSVGVLIEEAAEAVLPANDGSGDCVVISPKSPRTSTEHPGHEDKLTSIQDPTKLKTKTTFADKARNGMLRQSSMQAKSVPNNINRLGTSGTKGSASNTLTRQSSGGGKNPPSYRSNIASRCRTAVNTNKQQVPSPVKSKFTISSSLASSAAISSSVTSPAPKFHSLSRETCELTNSNPLSSSTCKQYWNSSKQGSGSGQLKQAQTTSSSLSTSSSTTKRTTTFASNNLPSSAKALGSTTKSENGDKKKHLSGSNVTSSRQNQNGPTTRQGESQGSGNSRVGIVRSKSMINPPSSAQSSRKPAPNNNTSSNRAASGKKSQQLDQNKSTNKNQQHQNTGPKDSKNKNFVSLPDVSVHRKRNSTVDEDGWETVRARSNRTKWSPSGSSLSIPLVAENGSSANVSSHNHNHSHSHTQVNTSSWKDEVDDEGVKEDEEIKRKEEDLDNAIREEELIEEELRQVEKDFEMIENESRDDTTTSENDNAPSPDGMHTMTEMDIEKEQFFFICMDDEAGAKGEDFPPREPGRIVALREKLMSPAKRCDSAETLRKHQAKLAKAERNREKLLQAKYNRYVELSERFEALNETTKKLVSEREELISKAEARLKRAEKNRKQYLQSIVKKAHDEDAKLKEIAFINLLEAQNKRHDYLASAHEIEGRLQTIQEEKRLKLEERSAKASLVIERQTRMRSNWQSKLEKMQEKRRKAEERITREKEEKAKERSELAQEKARDREERISALNAAKQAEKEELQRKIQQKQEDSARRHEENMEQIRQKAIELSVPRTQEENAVPATVRVCTLCKVSLPSEVQELTHLRGRAHIDAVKKAENLNNVTPIALENFGLKYVCDLQTDKIDFKVQLDKNRFKVLKKHCKKLMQKLVDSGLEYEKWEKESVIMKPVDPDVKAKIHKNIKELDRLTTLFENMKGTPAHAHTMDRLMTDIRKSSVKRRDVKDCVISLGAVSAALRVMKCSANDLPDKLRASACNLIVGINFDSQPNIIHCLRGTPICYIVEFCAERLNNLIPEGNRWITGTATTASEQIPYDPVLESVLEMLFGIINIVPDPFHGIGKEGAFDKATLANIKSRVMDIIGYMVASSVIDRFSIYCSAVRGPIENQPAVADLLKVILDFLIMNIYALHFCWSASGSNGKKEQDTTQLLAALESSELAGAVSMSYTLLLHQGAPTRPRITPGTTEMDKQPVPPPPGEKTASIVRSTLLLINAMARLDHQALQNVLGSEAVSLQFRHIASQLLWQVVPHRESNKDGNMRRLLNELLIAIAYFTVGNRHNQVTIQSGQTPTVLQQLCSLPQEFFKDINCIRILFPTLISACYGCPENVEILIQNNIDLRALNAFMQSVHANSNDILKKLKFTSTAKITDVIYGPETENCNGGKDKENNANGVAVVNGNVVENETTDGNGNNSHQNTSNQLSINNMNNTNHQHMVNGNGTDVRS